MRSLGVERMFNALIMIGRLWDEIKTFREMHEARNGKKAEYECAHDGYRIDLLRVSAQFHIRLRPSCTFLSTDLRETNKDECEDCCHQDRCHVGEIVLLLRMESFKQQ